MVVGNRRTAGRLLYCVAALLLSACAMTPEWTPRRRTAAECPNGYLRYCTHSNSGTKCGCVLKREMEAILRDRQQL
jgi:hypothetical protein